MYHTNPQEQVKNFHLLQSDFFKLLPTICRSVVTFQPHFGLYPFLIQATSYSATVSSNKFHVNLCNNIKKALYQDLFEATLKITGPRVVLVCQITLQRIYIHTKNSCMEKIYEPANLSQNWIMLITSFFIQKKIQVILITL